MTSSEPDAKSVSAHCAPKEQHVSNWAEQVATNTAQDKRAQPWKASLEKTHDQGTEGEDLINLQLPNHVQCGSLAA